MKKKMLLLICFISVILIISFCYVKITKCKVENKLLTKEQVLEDRTQVIKYLEEIHPFFLLEEDQSEYIKVKKDYIQNTSAKMTLEEFQIETSIYLSSLNDGHTGVWMKKTEENPFLQLEQIYEDGKTWLCKKGEKTNLYVKEIGNIPIAQIYEKIDQVFPIENEMGCIAYRESEIIDKSILKLCNTEIEGNTVEILFSDSSKKTYFFSNKRIGEKWEKVSPNSSYMEGNIFIIDFNECFVDENLKEIVNELKSAIDAGVQDVIIDARGNGGGHTAAPILILNAMGMYPPDFSKIVVRYSKWAKELMGYTQDEGIEIYNNNDTKGIKTNESINLIVLSDRDTFSSAKDLLLWVRDEKFGKIIGEPSTNKPNSYGGSFKFTLKNSKVDVSIAHNLSIRADASNQEDMLIPDIETSSEDAYDVAIEMIKNSTK